MRKIIFIPAIFLLWSITSYSQSDFKWYVQNYQINNNLLSVFFLDSLNGWICGSQTILKTSTGGSDWTYVTTTRNWERIFFISDSIGFVGGQEGIAKTYNGGLTWYNRYNTSEYIYDFCFLDSTTGIAVGGYNRLMKTTDAGETWIRSNLQPNITSVFLDVYFINDSIGWAAGLEILGGFPAPMIRELVVKTTDGGNNWTVICQNNNNLIKGIHFFDENYGVYLNSNKFYYTTNGGINWTFKSYTPYEIKNLNVINKSNIWAVGNKGGIYHSQDIGASWTSTFNDSNKTIRSIFFINDVLGWAVGDNGLILTTINPVVSSPEDVIKVELFNLSQNYPNPFNPSTSIQYAIGSRQFVTLKVYDVLGNEVAILVNEEKAAGNYEVQFGASNLSSGVYFYQLRAGNPSTGSGHGFVETKKMIYLK